MTRSRDGIERRRLAWRGGVVIAGLALVLPGGGPGSRARAGPGATGQRLDVVLTFDDGPIPESLGRDTETERVLNLLSARGIRAAFFVQIYARDAEGTGRFIRANTPGGVALLRRMHAEGHVIGIHSASYEHHPDHTTRVDGAGDPSDPLWQDFNWRLEDTLGRRGVHWLAGVTGLRTEFVRPCFGSYNAGVSDVYRAFGLKNILWDVDPRDWDGDLTLDDVAGLLRAQLRGAAEARDGDVVVIFHDVIPRIADNLEALLDAIAEGAQAGGATAVFARDAPTVRRVLREWWNAHPEVH